MLETIINISLDTVRGTAEYLGYELVVELSDHSINIRMERPNRERRAWDTNLYKSGNVFIAGYSNPIKPRVKQNQGLENPDTVEIEDGEPDEVETEHPELPEGEDDGEESPDVEVIASGRYRTYMRQHLIEQLLTPESRWNLLVWAVIGLGFLLFCNMLITLWATGSF